MLTLEINNLIINEMNKYMRPCSSYHRDNKGAYATIAISSQSKEFAFFLNF